MSPNADTNFLGEGAMKIEKISWTVEEVQQPAAPATQPIDADGLARGCKTERSLIIDYGVGSKGIGGILPSWVEATVSPTAPPAGPVAVTGLLEGSHISGSDFPLKPWHSHYDWNFHVVPDPQYQNLLSTANVRDRGGLLECEWEGHCLPDWARPQRGQRVWMVGRWIYDCGHEDAHGFRTEIHPPQALASFRMEGVKLPGSRRPTRASQAIVWMNDDGGYWKSDIYDRSYEFTFDMPPRPFGSQPRISIERMNKVFDFRTGFQVIPVITLNLWRTGGKIHVKIPMKEVRRSQPTYGAIISAGWSVKTDQQTQEMLKTKVTVEKIFMDANLDPVFRDEWSLHVGINGRWKSMHNLHGDVANVGHSVTLFMHPDDPIRISVSGYEADVVDDIMGMSSSVHPNLVSKPSSMSDAKDAGGKVRTAFVKAMRHGNVSDENDEIAKFDIELKPPQESRRISAVAPSSDGKYRVQYAIEPA